MKKVKYFIFSLLCIFSCSIVFADNEVVIKSITPIYDETTTIQVKNENNNYGVTFSEKDQIVKYDVVIENTSGYDLAVENINITKPSQDFVVYEVDGIAKTDVLKSLETKKLTITLKTIEDNNLSEDYIEDLLTTINFEKSVTNPFTSTKGLIVILVFAATVTGVSIILYRKNKLARYVALIIIFISAVPVVNAKEEISLKLCFNVVYETANVDMPNLLVDKNALFIGDSVQYGQGNNGKGWSYYIENNYSMKTVTNMAVSGASFTKNSNGKDRIINQLNNLTDTYDYVILEGGINDLTYGSTWGTLSNRYIIEENSSVVVEAIEETLYTTLAKFPNAKIGYILLYNTEDSGRNGHDSKLDDYNELILSICNKWNIPVFDMYNGSIVYNQQTITFDQLLDVHNKTYLSDGLHLNEEGYLLTYDYIAEWMQTLTTISIPEIEEETIVENINLGGNTYKVVNTITGLEWTKGYQLAQNGLIYNQTSSKSGRIASKDYVLKVSGGETITLSDNSNYSFALYEVNASNTLTGAKADSWLTSSYVLNTNTRYVGIYLKKNNEVDWTLEEIQNIPNILKISK